MPTTQPNAYYFDKLCRTRGVIEIIGRFFPNGSSALVAGAAQGIGYTVARTSAGLFTVTLDFKYLALVSAWCQLQLAAGDDKIAQFGALDLSARTITIRVWDISGAAETDVAANANNSISFGLCLRRTGVTK